MGNKIKVYNKYYGMVGKGEKGRMSKIEKEILDMTNLEIRDRILSLNKEQLSLIKEASYLNSFNSLLFLKRDFESISQITNLELSEEINLLNDYMNKAIDLIKDYIDKKVENVENHSLEDIISMRQELYDLSSSIEGYFIELSYIGMLVDDYALKILVKRDYENIVYDDRKVENLVDRIKASLSEAKEDYNKYVYIISQIILATPMKMIKDNYFNVVKNSLIRNFKDYRSSEVEKKIKEYKKAFDSSTTDGYGIKFDCYFTEIQKIRNISFVNKGLEDLSPIVDEIMNLTKELNILFDFILRLGLVMNMIIVIRLSSDRLLDTEMGDMYKDWINVLEDDVVENKEFKEKIERKIGKVEEGIASSLKEFDLFNSEALNRVDFNYDELSQEFIHARKVLTYYNDIGLSDHNTLFLEEDDIVSYDYLEQVSDSLIQYINRSLSRMSNMERKIRMKKLLSAIDLPFRGIDEFTNYIRYSLDSKISSKEEINYTIDHILYILNETNKSI